MHCVNCVECQSARLEWNWFRFSNLEIHSYVSHRFPIHSNRILNSICSVFTDGGSGCDYNWLWNVPCSRRSSAVNRCMAWTIRKLITLWFLNSFFMVKANRIATLINYILQDYYLPLAASCPQMPRAPFSCFWFASKCALGKSMKSKRNWKCGVSRRAGQCSSASYVICSLFCARTARRQRCAQRER